jgi:hypothetical protein
VTVYLPEISPQIKRKKCRELGATVVISGKNLGEAKTQALQFSNKHGIPFVNGQVLLSNRNFGQKITNFIVTIPTKYLVKAIFNISALIIQTSLLDKEPSVWRSLNRFQFIVDF